jgi:hypothetical protein
MGPVYIGLCQEENKHTLIIDIDNQNTTYVFASKGTHVAYLYLNPSISSKNSINLKSALETYISLYRVVIDMISQKWRYAVQVHVSVHWEA